MAQRRFIVQVGGRHALADLAGLDYEPAAVKLSTVLHVRVRDQAALQGLLHRLHDLGLSLIEVHDVTVPFEGDEAERAFEVTVEGPIGELVESALSDYIGPFRISSRYSFAEAAQMGAVLTRLLARGADIEHAVEQTKAS